MVVGWVLGWLKGKNVSGSGLGVGMLVDEKVMKLRVSLHPRRLETCDFLGGKHNSWTVRTGYRRPLAITLQSIPIEKVAASVASEVEGAAVGPFHGCCCPTPTLGLQLRLHLLQRACCCRCCCGQRRKSTR